MSSSAPHEKRRSPRQDCSAIIQWSLFSETSTHQGRILNFGNDGLCFETDEQLNPGTTVWIRVEKRLSTRAEADAAGCLPNVIVAVSKWCRAIPNNTARLYESGLRYEFPML